MIDHNTAPNRAGLYSLRAFHIDNTTISDNVGVAGAALSVEGPYSESVITQSTISGNVGGAVSGAWFASNGMCNAALRGAAL